VIFVDQASDVSAFPDAVQVEVGEFRSRFQRRGAVQGAMWHSTRLKLDELITRRYALDDVNQAYADMRSGVNIRGAVDFIPAG
jgi:Zn-dependent alcohol dehydrogenase